MSVFVVVMAPRVASRLQGTIPLSHNISTGLVSFSMHQRLRHRPRLGDVCYASMLALSSTTVKWYVNTYKVKQKSVVFGVESEVE